MATGPNPRYLEELRIGGGYGDPVDGGADFEKNGGIATNGDVTVDGALDVGGAASVAGTLSVTGAIETAGDLRFRSASAARIDLRANLIDDPIPLSASGWTGAAGLSNDTPSWAPAGAQSITVTDPGGGGNAWDKQLYRVIPAGSLVDGSKYTLSFWGKGSASSLVLNTAGFGMHLSPYSVFTRQNIPITTSWAFYTVTWTYTANGYAGSFRAPLFEVGANSAAGTFYFYHLKLERGEVATPFLAIGALDASASGNLGPAANPDLLQLETGKLKVAGDCEVRGGDLDAGVDGQTRGVLTAWDGSGGNTPGCIRMASPNGTLWYLFFEDDGTLKMHNVLPTQNSDGTVIGSQT